MNFIKNVVKVVVSVILISIISIFALGLIVEFSQFLIFNVGVFMFIISVLVKVFKGKDQEDIIINTNSIWADNEANKELLHGLSFMTIEKYNTYDMYARKIKTLQAQHTGMVYITKTHEEAEILMATANNKGAQEVCISTYAELGYIC